MADAIHTSIDEKIAAVRIGSVIAAAGCGKTEQIAGATKFAFGRRLILTHTHAGVDVLRQRLELHGVNSTQFHLDTIGGWCLRYAASFPKKSELIVKEPKINADWKSIYVAAAKLIRSGAVDNVLRASYAGVFVDEYQDCSAEQHGVVVALSMRLPLCVFGDHMQAIFDFGGQAPVDWDTMVYPIFPKIDQLTKPWRWHKVDNSELANWLEKIRTDLEEGRGLDFSDLPASIKWEWLPDQDGPKSRKITIECQKSMSQVGRLVVIADPVNLEGRAKIAKDLCKQGFSNIEPISCKILFSSAKAIDLATDFTRLEIAMKFLEKCMTGLSKSSFLKAVESRQKGGNWGRTRFGAMRDIGMRVIASDGVHGLPDLFEAVEQAATTYPFRRELYSAMRSGLKSWLAGQHATLLDAVLEVQNRTRHIGRRIAHRSVGSTLLVKGLEFEHAIIVHSPNKSRKDWYVALTRATHSVKILSPKQKFIPPH
jgi:hypothetical protein